MKLLNPLRSLSWNSLWRPGNRRRCGRSARTPVVLSAEVLEQRQLLSGPNVNLSVLAGAVTLAATDNGDHSVNVHRVDSTNLAFDVSGGTQITYLGVVHTSSFTVAVPTVVGVTVNLGGGYDTYNIFDLSTLGNITFNGHLGGEVGDDLNVYSQSANVVIGGSVVFNVGNQTGGPMSLATTPTPFAWADGDRSFEEVFTCTGNLTVNGSVFVTETGPARNEVDVFTNAVMPWGPIPMTMMGTGNLTVNGSLLLNQSGTGYKENDIYTDGPGNLTINGGVSVTQSGSGEHGSLIYISGSGNLTIGFGGVSIFDSGPGDHYSRIYTNLSGSILVKGNVSVFDSGTGFSEFDVESSNVDPGDVTIWGSVYYSNAFNTTGHDAVSITADTGDGSGVVTINGALTLLLANNASAGNFVQLGGDGDETETQVTIGGPMLLTSGAGADDIGIDSVLFRSIVTINTGTNPASMPPPPAPIGLAPFDSVSADFLNIQGSTFNSFVSISMYGPRAMIDVNNVSGILPTVFNGPVSIFMQGPNAAIFLSNGFPSGTTPVVFNSTLTVTGGIGGFPAGTLFISGPVHFTFPPLLINFNQATTPI